MDTIKPDRLLLLSLLLLSSNCAIPYTIPNYAKWYEPPLGRVVITINNKVGESVDSLERRQFNLFSDFKDFSSAVFYEISDSISGYLVEISKIDGNKYRAVNRDPKGREILKDYIDNFDTIQAERAQLMKNRKVERYIGSGPDKKPIYEKIKDPFDTKWRIVGYDEDLGLPITSEEIKLLNTKKTNANVYGCGCCLASCVVGPMFAAMMGMDILYNANDRTLGILGIAAGVLAANGAGYTMGTVIDKRETIKAIKAGRKLKIIE